MKAKTRTVGMLLIVVALVSMLSVVAAEETPVTAEINESATMAPEVDEAVNVSMNVSATPAPDDPDGSDGGILSFPLEGDILFAGAEAGYLIWQKNPSMGNDYKVSVGLVSVGMEVNSSNAEWVTVREASSSDSMGGYYTWDPPLGIVDDGEYNAIVLIDYETAGKAQRGTYNQETLYTKGPFNLVNLPSPPSPLAPPPLPPFPT